MDDNRQGVDHYWMIIGKGVDDYWMIIGRGVDDYWMIIGRVVDHYWMIMGGRAGGRGGMMIIREYSSTPYIGLIPFLKWQTKRNPLTTASMSVKTHSSIFLAA